MLPAVLDWVTKPRRLPKLQHMNHDADRPEVRREHFALKICVFLCGSACVGPTDTRKCCRVRNLIGDSEVSLLNASMMNGLLLCRVIWTVLQTCSLQMPFTICCVILGLSRSCHTHPVSVVLVGHRRMKQWLLSVCVVLTVKCFVFVVHMWHLTLHFGAAAATGGT